MDIIIGAVYKHYKGNYYVVDSIAIHSETGEKLVIYRALYDKNKVFARPYNMFIEKINKNNQEYRFQLQENNDHRL